MNTDSTLRQTLQDLKEQRDRLQDQGLVLFDCWIGASKPGGTARKARIHYQLRSRTARFDGKKSRYLKRSEVGEYQAAIARGKAIKRLDRQIEILQNRLAQVETLLSLDTS